MIDQKPLGFHSMVALIPARHGSKRCPGKNTRKLAGKPLLSYAIDAAKQSKLFQAIVVSTDDLDAYAWAKAAGVDVHQRNPEHATDTAPDFLWVNDVMQGRDEEIFSILRPTSPFRTASTIRRCYAAFIGSYADSIRAVQPVKEHPCKMWRKNGRGIDPVVFCGSPTPFHSMPTQSIPGEYYVQNASLEMAWTYVLNETGTISGYRIAPFFTDAMEGFDINVESDMVEAQRIIDEGKWTCSASNSAG